MSELFRLPPPPSFNSAKAEELKRIEEQRVKDAAERLTAIVDDILEEFGLGHPATAIREFLEDFSPYSILTRKLGIPAPGDVLDYIRYQLAAFWKSLPPLINPPPGVPEVRHLKE